MTPEQLEGKEFLGQVIRFFPGTGGKGAIGWIYPIAALNGNGDLEALREHIKENRNGKPDLFFNPHDIKNKDDVPAKTEGLNSRTRASYVPLKSFFRFRFHQGEGGIKAIQLVWISGKEAKSLLNKMTQEVKSE